MMGTSAATIPSAASYFSFGHDAFPSRSFKNAILVVVVVVRDLIWTLIPPGRCHPHFVDLFLLKVPVMVIVMVVSEVYLLGLTMILKIVLSMNDDVVIDFV